MVNSIPIVLLNLKCFVRNLDMFIIYYSTDNLYEQWKTIRALVNNGRPI